MEPIPNTSPPDWPPCADSCFASSIATDSHEGCPVCLVGLPDDLGVRLNQGRLGASQGPQAFRQALASFGTHFDALRGRPINNAVFDAGDILPSKGTDAAALEATHDRVTQALFEIHSRDMIPICIGGGHDLTLATVGALSQHQRTKLGGINLDAHLDVRDTPGSGMPFRKLIENEYLDPRRFTTLGVGRFSNTQEHHDWLEDRGGHIVPVETVLSHASGAIKDACSRMTTGNAPDAPCFVTFDLDAIDASQAPGVSANNPCGVRAEHAIELARRTSRDPRIEHFDIMELNPVHDIDSRTAKLAALIFLTIVSGISDRYT
jgi:formiminoglutamase